MNPVARKVKMKTSPLHDKTLSHAPRACDARGIRRLAHAGSRRRGPSAALLRALAETDRRLESARDPLACLTRERFEANRAAGCSDDLGVGPRLAAR
jgi:hypothetical protein